MKELKELLRGRRHCLRTRGLWNPVKELKGTLQFFSKLVPEFVESGEGIESSHRHAEHLVRVNAWNPVKELKGEKLDEFRSFISRGMWNPVKELKEISLADKCQSSC